MIAHIASSLLHGADAKGCFIAEASELGFPPGEWPKEIRTRTKTFIKFAEKMDGGNLTGVIYLGEGGGRLTVSNN